MTSTTSLTIRGILEQGRRPCPWCSPTRDVTPSGRGGFHALAAPLRLVIWSEKFKAGHIDKYDGSNNPKEFIQNYHTIIEAVGGDDRVKANYLPTVLSSVARSWLINLLEGSIYTWDQLYTMFIGNFQGTYERQSTAKTLNTIKKKHDESLWEYVKCFCNTRNANPYIQDIKIINVFHDGMSDIKTIEEIAMKKPKTVGDFLTVTNMCIEASEAWARLLESRGKGPQRRSRTIGRSTQLITEIIGITEIVDIAGITSSSPQIRRRRDHFIALLT
jgi:hypothetical protein